MLLSAFRPISIDRQDYWLHLPTNSLFMPNSDISCFLNGYSSNRSIYPDNQRDSIYRKLAALEVAASIQKKKPERITRVAISTTMDCNLRCKYCYNEALTGGNVRKLQNLNITAITKIASDIELLPIKDNLNVVFIGGEPFLYPSKVEMAIDELKDRFSDKIQLNFSATTNGMLIGKKEVIELINRHQINIAVSVDGERNTHNQNRVKTNGHGSYDSIVRNLRIFLPRYWSPIVSARATVNLVPGKIIGAYVHARDMGFNNIAIGSPDFTKNTDLEKDRSSIFRELEELFELVVQDYISSRIVKFSWAHDVFVNLHYGRRKTIVCGAAQNYLAFDPNGELRICHRFQGDQSIPVSIDDIVGTSKSALLSNVLDSSKTTSCTDCWARYLCGGECYHVVREMQYFGGENEKRSLACEFKRKVFQEAIKSYIRLYLFSPELAKKASIGELISST